VEVYYVCYTKQPQITDNCIILLSICPSISQFIDYTLINSNSTNTVHKRWKFLDKSYG